MSCSYTIWLDECTVSIRKAYEWCFREHLDKCTIVFIDDILIYSWNWKEQGKHLRIVLGQFWEHQLSAKLRKYNFWQRKGLIFGQWGFGSRSSMDPEKNNTILERPTPKSATAIHSFWVSRVPLEVHQGFCQYSNVETRFTCKSISVIGKVFVQGVHWIEA